MALEYKDNQKIMLTNHNLLYSKSVQSYSAVWKGWYDTENARTSAGVLKREVLLSVFTVFTVPLHPLPHPKPRKVKKNNGGRN